ncbi:hypothetical protein DLAC_07230 [Tieghemostelium lacteum]|uniref:RING-type domain-containing protein n=1 Tax=Tieghemostelium lacteum TaxID=361077 RepID=A0A151ZD83_TIELA|nr:hypothetical protein DLAC_07230 [Tieghemostelium lacteum]|eukprot:KYQ91889.1 hypothetical protein DLAC_07230 [Tieghemostelium lacteum]
MIKKITNYFGNTNNNKKTSSNRDKPDSINSILNQNKKKKCKICYIKYPSSSFIKMSNDIYSSCTHQMCRGCATKTFEMDLNRNKLDIQCIWCNIEISEHIIRSVIGKNYKLKFTQKTYWECPSCCHNISNTLNGQLMNQISKISTSTSSNDSIQNHFEVECKNCKYLLCTSCNESHPNLTCQEYLKDDENKLQCLNWKLSNTKRCPKCVVFIEKRGGCNYMSCWNCSFCFCFDCMKPYTSLHQCDHELSFKVLFTIFALVGSLYIVYFINLIK